MMGIVKVIPSSCGLYRSEIVKRPAGGFQMTVFRWTEEWVPDYGKVGEFWVRVSRIVTITDTVERAEVLAAEKFQSLGTSSATIDEGG